MSADLAECSWPGFLPEPTIWRHSKNRIQKSTNIIALFFSGGECLNFPSVLWSLQDFIIICLQSLSIHLWMRREHRTFSQGTCQQQWEALRVWGSKLKLSSFRTTDRNILKSRKAFCFSKTLIKWSALRRSNCSVFKDMRDKGYR